MEIKGHKAFLIDVEAREIKDIVIRDWTQIRDYIGEECDSFTCPISWANGDTVYADDEGLFHTINGGVVVPDFNQILVGNIVVIGCDLSTGESKDVNFKKDELSTMFTYMTKEQAEAYANHLDNIGGGFIEIKSN